MNILAIDPGANGGLAIWGWKDGERTLQVERMGDTYPNIHDALSNMKFYRKIDLAVIEKVGMHRAGNNASASAKFARHLGHLEMALYSVSIPVQWVAPKTWMKALGTLPQDKAERKRRVKELMQARYPQIDVTLWSADALGILTWALSGGVKERV